MSGKILVTGALGNVGAEVAKQLIQKGLPVRLADIDVEKVRQRYGEGTDAVLFAFGRGETYAPAFNGVEKVFLMRPPQISDVKKYMLPAIDAAIAAGVKHFVFLSLIGIEKNKIVPHYKVEQHLLASGKAWTFLRASFFMQNLNTTHRAEIRERGEIYVPVGKGKTSFIDVRDIGAVGALALSGVGHEFKAYDLTGPQALDYYEVAGLFSQILGREIVYKNPSVLAYLRQSLKAGHPLPFALVTTGLYTSTRMGMARQVTGEVKRLLGREPISLRQYIEDYKDCWL